MSIRIAELARRTGVDASAIRWYESTGILPPPRRTDNGYREYDDRDVARLRLVLSLRRLGVPPSEAGRLATACVDDGSPAPELGPLIAEQHRAIARRRDDLDRLESELVDLEAALVAIRRRPLLEKKMNQPIRVLFVCTHNSARSQIAEALLERYGGREFDVMSAGTEVSRVNPFAIRVLAELGIDWSNARSKAITEFLGETFDYVITVCDRARETCPVFPGSTNSLHWGLDDPSEVEGGDAAKLDAFRRTRSEVAARLRPFIEIALRAGGRPQATRPPVTTGSG